MAEYNERYGPVALVTGASSGIGRAFADALAIRGFDLVLAARRLDRLEDAARELSADYGVQVTSLEIDLTQVDAAERIATATADLDIGLVVSNAGFSMKGEHAANAPAVMTEMLMVNCHAPMQLTHAFIPRLRRRGRGGIVLTSSIEALIGCPYSGAYSATKALVKSLGEALWAELHNDNIDVLTLCPGATESEGLARSGFDAAKMPHVMTAADVAARTLERIADGPLFVSSDHYRDLFEKLTAMPRREALLAMAAGMAPSKGS